MHINEAEKRNFINKVRAALRNKNYENLDKRRSYRRTIAALGITDDDVMDDIMNLSWDENWTKEKDKNSSFGGYVWQCKKILHNNKIYIKLKIKVEENGKLLIMSYHFDEI